MNHNRSLRIRLPHIFTVALLVSASSFVIASDWPAYRHDARRSAVSTDKVEFPLALAWHRTNRHAPRPAFADPLSHPSGIDFAYIRDHSEPILLNFDHAFHPVAAAGRVFFGSSADDSVRCLSLATGQEQWSFVTGGPVRFAPQVVDDRVFAASDDGSVYCLKAASGKLIWQFRAAPSERQLVGNGRMISRWPLRSGVLVQDDTLYVTAGMWPAEGVFVYALDATSGEVKWINDTSGIVNQRTASPGAYAIAGVAPTGYLLAGKDALVVPTGRSIPASYSLQDGRLLKSVPPSYQNRRGGPATCIDLHGSIIYGYPRERLTGTAYSVHYAYRLPMMQPYGSMRADRVLADKETYLTVNDLIQCITINSRYTSRNLKVHWQEECPSKSVRCMALSANALLMGIDDRIVARDRVTGEVLWEQTDLDGYVLSLAVVDGQILAATDAGSIYYFAADSDRSTIKQRAEAPVTDKKPIEPIVGPMQKALQDSRSNRGLALVIGQKDTQLAEQLAADSQLQVVLLLNESDQVSAARQELLRRSDPDHGQVSVQRHIKTQPLPFADYAFNIIVSTGEAAVQRASELHRVLRPAGGVLYVDSTSQNTATEVEDALRQSAAANRSAPTLQVSKGVDNFHREGNSLTYRRGKLAGALDWDSENTRDERVKWPLELLWFGGPGSKRTGSGSRAPVAAGGRNLVVGKNHLIALDAYNGTELWSRTLPYLYRNIGRLKKGPGPIKPWLTQSVNADDDYVWLNFGHVVYKLDAATGEQLAVHGELPVPERFSLKAEPRFVLDHYQKPDARGTVATRTKAEVPAGSIRLLESTNGRDLNVIMQLEPDIEITDTLYWELFFDVRSPEQRANLYEKGVFHLLVKPAAGRVENGIGPAHPEVSVAVGESGRHMLLTIPLKELADLGDAALDSFSFAAALNHTAAPDQKAMAVGRGYLRWELHADAFATAFNNGWPLILRNENAALESAPLASISALPEHALKSGRIGRVGKKAGYVVNVSRERENPLSLDMSAFEYNRGKGCGNPVSSSSLDVLRSGTLAFYDLDDDSGMRYFGGIRPSCTVSAVPAQGLVFAAEGSSGCSCNYNFKATLALAPARQRRNEDWAMYTAPLSPAALLQMGRFNLGAPGDRRDDNGGLWLQYPRAPTYSSRLLPHAARTMPVPVELSGAKIEPYRVNADRVAIANTDRPWLYASGLEGIEHVRLQLFMSDKEGIVVFRGEAPKLDAVLEDESWERRYSVPAGTGSSMFLSHDADALYVGYEIVPPLDRRGKRLPWTTKGKLPHTARFTQSQKADDAAVWEEDSLEFLISDTSLKTILHFGVGVTGGRYDGLWSAGKKTEDAGFSAKWSGALHITTDKALAEFALPWNALTDAGLDLDNLVIRPRTMKPLTRHPHITHGFRPVLVQRDQPAEKHYQVSLLFAELSDVAPGQRVFDVEIQGRTVLKSFDPVAAAGGKNRAVVQSFERIRADRALDIRFISHAETDPESRRPMLSALEVLLEN